MDDSSAANTNTFSLSFLLPTSSTPAMIADPCANSDPSTATFLTSDTSDVTATFQLGTTTKPSTKPSATISTPTSSAPSRKRKSDATEDNFLHQAGETLAAIRNRGVKVKDEFDTFGEFMASEIRQLADKKK